MHSAILNAYNNNVLLVAAMGNEYQEGNPTNYPAAFPEVIAVGNTTNTNPPSRWSTSSTGPHICVSAPGHNIWSTIRGGGTGAKTGTSMSAPVVSGVAGLIISQGMDRGFNLTNNDVRHIIERPAVDIGTAGFDNETGYGIVNAYNALHLLDEPNELFHYNSVGGSFLMVQNFSRWIITGNYYGLAAGTYVNVDQYKITKHITFDIPFCSIPQIWMRERQSACLSGGNPNQGRPFSIISNITNTGFDIEYFTYYVHTNILGQDINQWIPAAPASTNVAYTAVGEPNFAGAAGPLSGPILICSSGASFSVANLHTEATIEWNKSANLTRVSAQGANPCTFSANGSGEAWIEVTINSSCDSITLPRKTVWAGTPVISNISGPTYTPNYQWATYYAQPNNYLMAATDYEWILNPLNGNSVYDYGWSADIAFYNSGYYQVVARAQNTCGWSSYAVLGIEVYDSKSLSITPNPSNGEVTISIASTNEKGLVAEEEWEMAIYDQSQLLKERKTSLRGQSTKIQTTGWKEGVYMVRVKYKDEILTGKLIVKK